MTQIVFTQTCKLDGPVQVYSVHHRTNIDEYDLDVSQQRNVVFLFFHTVTVTQ